MVICIDEKILNRNRSRYPTPVSFIYHTSYAPAAQRTPTIFPGAAEPTHHTRFLIKWFLIKKNVYSGTLRTIFLILKQFWNQKGIHHGIISVLWPTSKIFGDSIEYNRRNLKDLIGALRRTFTHTLPMHFMRII